MNDSVSQGVSGVGLPEIGDGMVAKEFGGRIPRASGRVRFLESNSHFLNFSSLPIIGLES